jgi:hypothetical protein
LTAGLVGFFVISAAAMAVGNTFGGRQPRSPSTEPAT